MFVQLVIAAITTEPFASSNESPLSCTRACFAGDPSTIFANELLACLSATRSCGRLGPATVGSTVPRSSCSVSVNAGSGVASVRNSPCSLLYASTNAICSCGRAVNCKYASVSASTGKKPIVAPYSGAMLAIVARSGTLRFERPLP